MREQAAQPGIVVARIMPVDPNTNDAAQRPQGASTNRRAIISKDTAEAFAAWIGVIIRLAIVSVAIIAVFSPSNVPLLKRFGLRSSEINILGSKLTIIDTALSSPAIQMTEDGKLLIAGLDASQVPDRIARLEQTVKDQAGENASLKSNVQDLRDLVARTKAQLDVAISNRHGGSDDPVPTASLSADIARLTNAADATLKAADENGPRIASVLRNLDAGKATGFGVVFGGDSSPDAAMDEVRKAHTSGIGDVALYQRQGSWRSVALFGTQAAAAAALPVLRRQRGDAYIVDLSKWCPLASPIAPATDGTIARESCGF